MKQGKTSMILQDTWPPVITQASTASGSLKKLCAFIPCAWSPKYLERKYKEFPFTATTAATIHVRYWIDMFSGLLQLLTRWRLSIVDETFLRSTAGYFLAHWGQQWRYATTRFFYSKIFADGLIARIRGLKPDQRCPSTESQHLQFTRRTRLPLGSIRTED